MRHRGSRTKEIGCILLVDPVSFAPHEWISQPRDWPARSLRGTRYDLARGEGRRVWQECLDRTTSVEPREGIAEPVTPGLGAPR
ncbi:MAG: hypothetical protein ACE5F1_18215, partial [Planctomycetota bacterium]